MRGCAGSASARARAGRDGGDARGLRTAIAVDPRHKEGIFLSLATYESANGWGAVGHDEYRRLLDRSNIVRSPDRRVTVGSSRAASDRGPRLGPGCQQKNGRQTDEAHPPMRRALVYDISALTACPRAVVSQLPPAPPRAVRAPTGSGAPTSPPRWPTETRRTTRRWGRRASGRTCGPLGRNKSRATATRGRVPPWCSTT